MSTEEQKQQQVINTAMRYINGDGIPQNIYSYTSTYDLNDYWIITKNIRTDARRGAFTMNDMNVFFNLIKFKDINIYGDIEGFKTDLNQMIEAREGAAKYITTQRKQHQIECNKAKLGGNKITPTLKLPTDHMDITILLNNPRYFLGPTLKNATRRRNYNLRLTLYDVDAMISAWNGKDFIKNILRLPTSPRSITSTSNGNTTLPTLNNPIAQGVNDKNTNTTAINKKNLNNNDNVFEINDENVLYPYPSGETLHFLDDLQKFSNFNGDPVSSVQELVSQHFIVNGSIVIPNNIKLTMINNKFSVNSNNLYVNESILIEYDMPWIYVEQDINDTDSIICMNGNEFTNFAISLNQGNITSCVKNDILNYIHTNDCHSFGTFGAIYQYAFNYNQGEPNVFNINYPYLQSIIVLQHNTYFALENNIINLFGDGYNIFNIQQGNYLLVDTMINGNDIYNIQINTQCTMHCYSLSKTNKNSIAILDIGCNNGSANGTTVSIDDFTDAEFVTHFSPNSISVTTMNDSTYFPSDRLLLNYVIIDQYNNKIKNIGQNLIINFNSMTDTQSFQITIDSKGDCIACKSGGILFPEITLNDMGHTLTFQGSVENNYLFVDGLINVTIIECPSGYGSNTAKQCDKCVKGYFNLLPSNESCYYCEEKTKSKGITCLGGDDIIIGYNYWAVVYQY
eukprot:283770_1